jgi:hypothetical protein
MKKNTDMLTLYPNLRASKSSISIDRDTLIAIIAIASMIIITAVDLINRAEIINTANQLITERDDRINQLENIIDQIMINHITPRSL